MTNASLADKFVNT